MNKFYYVYILVSEMNESVHYTGVTADLKGPAARAQPGKLQLHCKRQALENSNVACLPF